MDRADADQEGITLPPANHFSLMARREAERVIENHIKNCPFATLHIEERIRSTENRFMLLVGFMFGSGLLGGAAGAAVFKALGG